MGEVIPKAGVSSLSDKVKKFINGQMITNLNLTLVNAKS
jgi:hypothetical protein